MDRRRSGEAGPKKLWLGLTWFGGREQCECRRLGGETLCLGRQPRLSGPSLCESTASAGSRGPGRRTISSHEKRTKSRRAVDGAFTDTPARSLLSATQHYPAPPAGTFPSRLVYRSPRKEFTVAPTSRKLTTLQSAGVSRLILREMPQPGRAGTIRWAEPQDDDEAGMPRCLMPYMCGVG